MNTNLNTNDPFDRWLQENADNGIQAPKAGDWDAPSPRVWKNLREELDRRKRKRRLFWFFFAGMGLLLGATWALSVVLSPNKPGRAFQVGSVPATRGLHHDSIHTPNTLRIQRNQPDPLSTNFGNAPKPDKIDSPERPSFPSNPEQPLEAGSKNQAPFKSEFPRIAQHWILLDLDSVASNLVQSETNQWMIKKVNLPAEKNLPRQDAESPFTPKVHPSPRFYLSFVGGAGISDRKIQNTDTGIVPNGKEKGAWTGQWGIGVGYRLNKHFALETGLQHAAILLVADRKGQFKYNSAGEVFDPLKNEFVNSIEKTLETAFGAIDIQFDLYRDASQPIPDQTKVKVEFHTEERVSYARIPLGLRYWVGKRRLKAGLSLGAGLNIQTGYRAKIEFSQTDQVKIHAVQAKVLRRATGMSKCLGDGFVGLGLSFRLSSSWEIGWDAEYRRGFTTMYRNGPYVSYPVSIGAQLGLRWNIRA